MSKAEVESAIRRGVSLSDEWCGPWCKPIHVLIRELGARMLASRVPDVTQEQFQMRLHEAQEIEVAHSFIHQIVCSSSKAALTGKSRLSMAAAALFLANQVLSSEKDSRSLGRFTEHQFAALSGITEVTLRNNCRALADACGGLIAEKYPSYLERTRLKAVSLVVMGIPKRGEKVLRSVLVGYWNPVLKGFNKVARVSAFPFDGWRRILEDALDHIISEDRRCFHVEPRVVVDVAYRQGQGNSMQYVRLLRIREDLQPRDCYNPCGVSENAISD
jgi:hypothetical protein